MANKDGQTGHTDSAPASSEHVQTNEGESIKPEEDCFCKEHIDESLWIRCDWCIKWCHLDCVGLTGLDKDQVLLIKQYKCPHCIVNATTVLIKLSETINETITNAVKNSLQNELPTAMAAVKKEIVNESSSKVKSYVDAAKVDLQATISDKPPTQLVKATVQQIDADKIQRIKRECNVIIKGIPEIGIKENRSQSNDLKFLHETCGMEEDEIVSCFRAGKLTESGESKEHKPRPLIVQLKSKQDALYWSNYGKGWKVEVESDNAKKEVYWINQDLNKADRDAQFFVRLERRTRLAEKAKQKNA